MATRNQAGHEPAQPQFLFTYGTGGVESPDSLRAMSPKQLHRQLLTQYQREQAWWATRGNRTLRSHERWLKQRPHQETIFPFVRPGGTLEATEANLQGEPDGQEVASQHLSGLALISFRLFESLEDAAASAEERQWLWSSLLAIPLLGPSLSLQFTELDRQAVHVLVAIGASSSYATSVKTIINYLLAVDRPLGRRIFRVKAAMDPRQAYWVGSDPLARWQQAPVPFPAEQALPIIKHKQLMEWGEWLEESKKYTDWVD